MRSFFSTLAALSFTLLGVLALRTWWVGQEVLTLAASPRPRETTQLQPAVSLESLRQAPHSPLHPALPSVLLFERLAALARTEADVEQKAKLSCEALSALGRAIAAEPRNARYLINWANTRQFLGTGFECSEPFTDGSFEAAAAAALTFDPTNVDVLFAAARIFEWAGQREEAMRRLNQVLLLATRLEPGQRLSISRSLQTPEDIQAVIPARFPQVAEWSLLLRDGNPVLFRAAAEVLSSMQLQAIRSSRQEMESGKIPPEIHEKRLLSLYRAPAGGSVRRELDNQVASQSGVRGQSSVALYLSERRRLEEADVVRAAIVSDTRPLKSPLLRWSPQEELCVDDFYASLGFFLPEGESPKLIELVSRGKLDQAQLNALAVFVSEDNQTWSQLQGNVRVTSVDLGDRTVIAIRPNSTYFKYWKVSANSAARSKKFCELPHQLLTVYRTASDAYS